MKANRPLNGEGDDFRGEIGLESPCRRSLARLACARGYGRKSWVWQSISAGIPS